MSPLKHSGYHITKMLHALTFSNSKFCPQSVFMGFIWFSE